MLVDSDDIVGYRFKDPTGLKLVSADHFAPRATFGVHMENPICEISPKPALPEPERMVDILERDREAFVIQGSHRETDEVPGPGAMMNVPINRDVEGLPSVRIHTKWGSIFPDYIHPSVLHRPIGVVKKASNHGKMRVLLTKILNFFKKL